MSASPTTYRIRARITSATAENKIHDDVVARRFGFKGGLVSGATLYAYMTHPVVTLLGREWLESGSFSVRFRQPVYEGETVTVSVQSQAANTWGVSALNPDGEPCALGTAALAPARRSAPPDVAAYPPSPLPLERPPATRELLENLGTLGSPELGPDPAEHLAYLDEVEEPLSLYREPGAPAHPGLILRQANRALDRNVWMGAWMHVASEVQHWGPWRQGEPLVTRGRVAGLWEKNGHEYVELDLLMVAGERRPVAHVRHRCIYRVAAP